MTKNGSGERIGNGNGNGSGRVTEHEHEHEHEHGDAADTKRLTIVIKLGTSSIVDEKTREPILSILTLIVEAAVKLRQAGHNVIIVSSGAVGVGLRRSPSSTIVQCETGHARLVQP
ncbi:hypothetical protein KEM52_005522 [Ascosphaera acerosa]|nr:hypothetical protein KEM52_005522 [Ascosphaera acerosa]